MSTNPHAEFRRRQKAEALEASLVTADNCSILDGPAWRDIANHVGVHTPSTTTVSLVIEMLRARETAKARVKALTEAELFAPWTETR